MSMAEFIERDMEHILSDWEGYAKTLLPAAGNMTKKELRNLGEAILRSVVADMESSQSEKQRHQKSLGNFGGSSRRRDSRGVVKGERYDVHDSASASQQRRRPVASAKVFREKAS